MGLKAREALHIVVIVVVLLLLLLLGFIFCDYIRMLCIGACSFVVIFCRCFQDGTAAGKLCRSPADLHCQLCITCE